MTNSQMDEIFKKQLPGHESPVPDDMWERIIRKKDKDRKGFFFFFSLAGLFLLGFGIAGILLFGINRKEIKRHEAPVNNSKAISKSGTVQSAGRDQHLKMNPSINHDAAFRGTDKVLNAGEHKHDQENKISSDQRNVKIPGVPLKKESSTSGIAQANSKIDSDTSLLKENSSLDTGKTSGKNAIPMISSTSKTAIADSAKTTTTKKSDSTKKNIGSNWSLDLYVSPDYPIDHNHQEYIKGQFSYTIGLRLNRSFGKHFSAKLGIQFSQLNYVLPDSSAWPGTYHLSRVDIPVLGGYSWGNETLGMTVNAGVIFNLYSKLSPDQFDYIKSNTGLSLYLGFNFSKHINERIDIFSEPYYRYQLSSMVISPNYFPKYIDVVGLSFGVRYHFKR